MLSGPPGLEAQPLARSFQAILHGLPVELRTGRDIESALGEGADTGNGVDSFPPPVIEVDPKVVGDRPVGLFGSVDGPLRRRSGEAPEQHIPVADRSPEPVVEHHGDPLVVGGADQPPHTLGERDGGSRDYVPGERVLALPLDQVRPGGHHGVADRVERDLLDDQQAQCLSGNVHPFPERSQAQQRGGPIGSHALHQGGGGLVSLGEEFESQWRQVGPGVVPDVIEPSPGCHQRHGAPAAGHAQSRDLARLRLGEAVHQAAPGSGQVVREQQ